MAGVRTVRPTDLVALVAYDGKVYPNEAVTLDRLGTEPSAPHPIETALEQWFSFATGRHTWISVKGATLRGLASARRRGSKAAWEMDCLIDAADDDPGVLLSLLDQVTRDAGRAKAEKVFLRVSANSDVVNVACRAGFAAVVVERLLWIEEPERAGRRAADVPGLRRWVRTDTYPAFRLYTRWAPEQVRRLEAPTFREWQAARERLSGPRGTRQWVIERDGNLVAWLRTAADDGIGRFEVQADADQPSLLNNLIDAALDRLHGQFRLFTLVPAYAVGLHERLLERGFSEGGEYVVLARRTARPLEVEEKQAAAAPVQASPA